MPRGAVLGCSWTFLPDGYGPKVLPIGDDDTISVLGRGQTINGRLDCIEVPERVQSSYGLFGLDRMETLLPDGLCSPSSMVAQRGAPMTASSV